jgi:hypothetical protein
LIDENDILPTIGGFAIAVWHRIEPLVQEARIRENAYLFQNFEAVLPTCHECVVPTIEFSRGSASNSTTADGGSRSSASLWRRIWFSRVASVIDFHTLRVTPSEAKQLIEDGGGVILDVTRAPQRQRIRDAVRPNSRDLSGWLAAVREAKSVVTYCT